MSDIFNSLNKKLEEHAKRLKVASDAGVQTAVGKKDGESSLEMDIAKTMPKNKDVDNDVVVPEEIKHDIGKPSPTENFEVAKENVINAKKQLTSEMIIPATDKEEMKRACSELFNLIDSTIEVNEEKNASFKRDLSESNIVKAASALKGAINMIEKMENNEKIAKLALRVHEQGILDTEEYADTFHEVKKVAMKLDSDVEAMELYFNKIAKACDLASHSGESDIEIKGDHPFDRMMEIMES